MVELIHILSCIMTKKITLLPLSPADIRKHFKELAENDTNTPTSNESSDAKTNRIKLKK